MTHEQSSELLTQYLLGDLPAAEAAEIKSHLETCEACRAEAQRIGPTLDLLSDALAAPSSAPKHLDASRHVRIITQTTNRKRTIIRWFTVSHPRLSRAAVFLFAFSFIWVSSGQIMWRYCAFADRYRDFGAKPPTGTGSLWTGPIGCFLPIFKMGEVVSGGAKSELGGDQSAVHVPSAGSRDFMTWGSVSEPSAPASAAAPASAPADGKYKMKIEFNGYSKAEKLTQFPVIGALFEKTVDKAGDDKLLAGKSAYFWNGGSPVPATPPASKQVGVAGRVVKAQIAERATGKLTTKTFDVLPTVNEKIATGEQAPAADRGSVREIGADSDSRPFEFHGGGGGKPTAVAEAAAESPNEKPASVGGDMDTPLVPSDGVAAESPIVLKGMYGNRAKGDSENAPPKFKAYLHSDESKAKLQAGELQNVTVTAVGYSKESLNAEELQGGTRGGKGLSPSRSRNEIAQSKPVDKRAETLDKLEKIKIPEIDFRQANIKDVVEFLNSAGVEYGADDKPASAKAPKIELNLGESSGPEKNSPVETPLITFQARYINAEEALRIVTSVAGLKYRVGDDGRIMVEPKNAPEGTIINRMYDVLPTMNEKIAKAAAASGITAGTGQGIVKEMGADAATTERSDGKDYFASMGVQWPEGSKIKYLPAIGKLVVANTQDNLDGLDDILDKLQVKPTKEDEEYQRTLWSEIRLLTPKNTKEQKERAKEQRERQKIISKLDQIKIPEIDFREAKIKDVVNFLNAAGIEYDQSKSENKGVNIALDIPVGENNSESNIPPITFSARYISALEALRIVTQVAGLKYQIDESGVKVTSRNASDKMITSVYSCPSDAAKLISQISSEEIVPTITQDHVLSLSERWKELFGELGVEWPAGSSINYDPKHSKIIIVNTFDNIGILEKMIGMGEEKPKEQESPTSPRFKASGVNPFIDAAQNAFSTFAIDCDTASYTLMRNYMSKGSLPPAESARTEEFVNFFDYNYTPPTHDTFAVYVDAAPSRFGHGLTMLKIGVKGRRLGREEQRHAVLTFLVDTSGSMNQPDRIGLVKKSLKMLVEKMNPQDMIAIVQFDSHARLVLELTAVADKQKILAAIDNLLCGGSTNLGEGMQRAYEIAAGNFTPGGENRVLILSDGVANLGTLEAADILKSVEKYRKQGIFCSVFGVGIGNYNDEMLQQLANKGDGSYTFIDSEDEARRVLVDDLSATLNTIAKDVKIQVEFNPAAVKRYRQLGYESRQLKKEDFRNDAVDAGEVGSGQSVTALYELEVFSGQRPALRSFSEAGSVVSGRESEITSLDTSKGKEAEASARHSTLGTVRVRYKRTDNGKIEEIEQPILADKISPRFDDADVRFRLAACAAEFSEILRGSPFAEGNDFADVANALRPVALDLNLDTRVQEFLRLVQSAKDMPRGE